MPIGSCKKCSTVTEIDDMELCSKCSSEQYDMEVDIPNKKEFLRFIDLCDCCGRERPIYANKKCNTCYQKKHNGVDDKCIICGFDKIYALSLYKTKTLCSNCKLGIRWGLLELPE